MTTAVNPSPAPPEPSRPALARPHARTVRHVTLPLLAVSAMAGLFVLPAYGAAATTTDTPVAVTPYSGFNPILARAPYVTDLTQTSAYVTWATTSGTRGSVLVQPAVGGSCPASVTQWTTAAIKAPTSLPGPVNPPTTPTTTGMTGWAYSVVNGAGTTVHEYQSSVLVSGLTPGTRYCYAVFSSDSSSAVDLLPPSQPYQSFTTLYPTGSTESPVTFDVIGDTGENYSQTTGSSVPYPNELNPDQAALYQLIGASGAQFLLIAGDIAYSGGSQSNYGDLAQTGTQPEVGTIFGPSYFPQTGGIPTFAADGNHGQSVTTLRNWPTPVTATNSGGTYSFDSYSGTDDISGTFPDDWYAFSDGNVRVYVLDGAWADGSSSTLGSTTGSACATPAYCRGYQADADEHWQQSSPEYRWLAGDLAAHSGGIKFAVIHYPLRSDNATQPSDVYLDNIASNPNSLEELLADNGVGMVFDGHAHTYQRFNPIGAGQITNYVTGGGGGVLEPVLGGSVCAAQQQLSSVYALGWSPSATTPGGGAGSACGASAPPAAADVYHFLKVTVDGSTVTVTPTNAAGGTFDVQSYTFSASGTAPNAPDGLTATTGTGTGNIDLRWNGVADAAGYRIYRDGGAVPIGTSTGTSFADSGLAAGSQHSYTVGAFNAARQNSALSASVTGTAGPATIGGNVVSVPATDDATISKLAANANTNYGTLATLTVDADQNMNDFLLNFTVPSACTPTAAALTLTVAAGTNDGSAHGGNVYAAPGTWTDSTVTAANAPPAIGSPVSFGAVAQNNPYTIGVTTLMPSGAGPGSVISLRATTTSNDAAVYVSSRASNGATAGPMLTLTCGG